MTSGNKIYFPSPRNSFTRVIFLTVFCLVFVILTTRPTAEYVPHPHLGYLKNGSEQSLAFSPDCSINPTHLESLQQRFKLGETIDYGRRYIRFHRQNIERKSMTKVDTELFPEGFDSFNISSPPESTTCLKPLEVAVPSKDLTTQKFHRSKTGCIG